VASLRLLALGDVEGGPAEADEPPLAVEDRHPARELPYLAPGAGEDALLDVAERGAALHGLGVPVAQPLLLAGRHELVGPAAVQLLRSVAEDLLGPARQEGVAAVDVELPDVLAGGLREVTEAPLRLAQLPLGDLPVGDVYQRADDAGLAAELEHLGGDEDVGKLARALAEPGLHVADRGATRKHLHELGAVGRVRPDVDLE
jgi:hypothetical protein